MILQQGDVSLVAAWMPLRDTAVALKAFLLQSDSTPCILLASESATRKLIMPKRLMKTEM